MRLFSKKRDQPSTSFGRQRPATGSMTPRIFSYHTRRSQELGATGRQTFRDTINAEAASKAARYGLRRFGLLLVILAAFCSLINALIVSSDPKVMPLTSNQPSFLQDTDVYTRYGHTLLASSLANRNKITLDSSGVSAAMQRQFPELERVSIKVPLLSHRPLFYLQTTPPVLLLTARTGEAYIIDKNGRVLADASRVKTLDELRLIHVKDDGSPARISTGQQVLASDTVAFMRTVQFQLVKKDLDVASFTLVAGKSEVDLRIVGQGYFVKLNFADDTPEQQVGTFLATRHTLQEQGITPAQYVDVRVPGRAYYK